MRLAMSALLKRIGPGWLFALFFLPLSGLASQSGYLKLNEVLESVNQYYPQIKIARLEISKAHGAHLSALGKFDPSLAAQGQSQPLGGYINNYGDTQLNIPTLYNGVKLFAGYRNGQGDWPIYYQNYLTNSGGEYRAGLSFPLLRDRLIDRERTNLLSTAEAVRMRLNEAEAVKIKIYQEAIRAYWQWVEAGLQLKTFKHLLKLAKTRQDAIERQARLGDLPQLAVAENLQQIRQRQQLLNQGMMMFEQAGVSLSLYYRDKQGKPRLTAESRLPPDLQTVSRPFKQNQQYLQNHPAILRLHHYSRMVKLKRDLARNELLPYLDANAYTFKQNGTGGYPLLIPQAAMIGLTFKFPLLQREAKGKLVSAQSELHQVQTERRFLYEQLKNEFANLLIGISRIGQQISLLKQEYQLALQVEKGETKKFFEGDSTLFLVNQREQLTTQVKLNQLNAQIQFEELKDIARYFITTDLGKRPAKTKVCGLPRMTCSGKACLNPCRSHCGGNRATPMVSSSFLGPRR